MTVTTPPASQFVLKRLPADDDELWWTIFALWGYRIPRQAVCPGHVSPFQALADAYFARYPSMIWKASRGLGGKSRTLAILGLTEATLLGCEVTVLGGSFAQSQNVHNATKEAWGWHASPRGVLAKANQFDTVLANGGHLRTLTASQTSVRGPHPPRLRMDEIDEMDQAILDAALGQPMEQENYLGMKVPTQTVMCLRGDMLVLTKRGEVPIKDVTVADHVLTRKGWRKVRRSVLSGMKPVMGLVLSNGRTLYCTDDHRIAVPGGWMLPKDMSRGQEVLGVTPDSIVSDTGLDDATEGSLLASVGVAVPDASTRPALTALPVRTDVLAGVGMPFGAVGLGSVDGRGSVASQGVHSGRYVFQMGGVTTVPVEASTVPNMVDVSVGVWDADQADVCPTVDGATVDLPVHHPVSPALAPLPAPTSGQGIDVTPALEPVFVVDFVLRHDVTLQYVYDIEVEDVHEFVAEGIVVHNSSTHQYPDGTMSTMIKRAKKEGFPVYTWCYKETSNQTDGWLTPQAIARARSVVSEHMWETEYDLQEPSFGARAIDTDAVDACFDPALGEFTGDRMVLTQAVPGRHYITAVDWAKSKDQTIIATFDTTDRPWRCVCWQKVNRLPWPMLVRTAVAQWRSYGDRMVHDATGVGAAAHDLIREQVTSSEMTRVHGVTMGGGRERDALYTEYISAIEHGDLKYPRITYAYDEHRYVTPEDLYTSKGHAPDSVVAGALAWAERRKGIVTVAPGGGVRSSSPWNV